MTILLRASLVLVVVCALLALAAYLDGRGLPVRHTVSVTTVLPATPERVFAKIGDVADGPTWRRQVKSVRMLEPESGHAHWVEELGRGMKIDFVALENEPPDASGRARRVVRLADAAYGGDWVYEFSPGLAPDETTLKITETGYIDPPLYRFMTVRVFGLRRNLDVYVEDLRAVFK